MSRFPNPGFDPHADAIDGAPVDPWPADRRVKVARKPVFDQHPSEWDVSIADLRDGVGIVPVVTDNILTPVRAVPTPIIGERVLPVPDHSMFEAFRVLFWIAAIGVPAVVVFTVGFMVGRWVA